MRTEHITYPSSDGIHQLHAVFYLPEADVPLLGVVQLAHGMCDYVGRYTGLAEALTQAGYLLCGNDHLGHGQSVSDPEELGFFAEHDGVGYVVDDLHALTGLTKERYPDLPYVLLGHSMGSFLCRLYASRFGYELDGLVILGTSGPNPILGVGKALASVIRFFRGARHRSRTLAKMAFMGYNSKYEKGCSPHAWISRDTAVLDSYAADPLSTFTFTVAAYQDLFSMLGESNAPAWFETFPKTLRTYVVAGDMDPVGSWGQGPAYVAETLRKSGVTDVTLRLYEGARHELFHETEPTRSAFFADLVDWLGRSAE